MILAQSVSGSVRAKDSTPDLMAGHNSVNSSLEFSPPLDAVFGLPKVVLDPLPLLVLGHAPSQLGLDIM